MPNAEFHSDYCTDPKYWAFISYSRKDEATASRLRKAIECYRIPRELRSSHLRRTLLPARLTPVFRDRDELPLVSDVGLTIERALADSSSLIVLCSRHSARSKWVNEEVRMFKAMGREDRIFALMIDGTPHAVREGKSPDEECFCPALAHDLDASGNVSDNPCELIAGDLREGGEPWSVNLMRCIAAIAELSFDDLAQRDARRLRNRRWAIAIVALAVVIGCLALWDHQRLKVRYYASIVERWGIPEGISELSDGVEQRRAESYRMEFTKGLLRRVVHQNGHGTPVADPAYYGAAFQSFQYDEHGKLRLVEFRDRNDRIVMQRQFRPIIADVAPVTQDVAFSRGREHATLALPSRDDSERQMRPYSPQEMPAFAEITAHRFTYRSDGIVTELRFLDPYNVSAPDADGIFGKRFHYAAGVIPSRIENLGPDGSPTENRHGVASISQTANFWGRIETLNRHDQGGRLVALEDGYAGFKRTYDDVGNLRRQEFLGTDGKLATHSDGIASAEWDRDASGNITEWRNRDLNGDLVNNRVGVAIERALYNARGDEIERVYFDRSGKRTLHSDGIGKVRRVVDEHGNRVEIAYFGIKDERTANRDGIAIEKTHYDSAGNPLETAFFNTGGDRTIHADGFSIARREFDHRGMTTSIRYFGLNDEPTLNRNRFHLARFVFDRRGNEIETMFFGIADQPVLHADGVSKIVRKFDSRGRVTEYSVFGTDGRPCNDIFGISRYLHEYDENSTAPTQTLHFDRDGQVVPQAHSQGEK